MAPPACAPECPSRDLRSGLLAGALSLGLLCGLAHAATPGPEERGKDTMPAGSRYHVDAASGDDRNDGLSPKSAWRTLDQVNRAALRPGDSVLFKRGQAWRGQLVPRSGEQALPVTYGAYGEGPKPRLLGSVSMNSPEDWVNEGRNIWSTRPVGFRETGAAVDLAKAKWHVHQENGAAVTVTEPGPDRPCYEIRCDQPGKAANHVQVFSGTVSVDAGQHYLFRFRAKCTASFKMPGLSIIKSGPPYTEYARAEQSASPVAQDWTEFSVRCSKASQAAQDGRLNLSLGGALPAGSTLSFQPLALVGVVCDQAQPLTLDVGNIIFDDGASCGVKKWKVEDLKSAGDYFYAGATWQVKLCSEKNPAEGHRSIELALRRHIVDQGGKHHVTYENLALYYGAAHGFGGGSTHHIVIRNCDVAFIGGGHQFTDARGRPVRFGNGIEFWGGAHDNLVEGCRIWEIYDAALTNQNSGSTVEEANITYRDNVIWNSEYSFEYWNRPPASRTEKVSFLNNTCVDAGLGWGHGQRPDPNGRHLMFYWNDAATRNVQVRNNVFCNSTESSLRMDNDWSAGLVMDRNLWFEKDGPVFRYLKQDYTAAEFEAYKAKTGFDAHSLISEPRFVDPRERDYRLTPDSPGAKWDQDGRPCGAYLVKE